MSVFNEILIFLAAVTAGFINAMAGGGTLVSFPVLLAVGISPVVANVTNTVALVPGTIGGMWAQRRDFVSQRARLIKLLPVSIIRWRCRWITDHSEYQRRCFQQPYSLPDFNGNIAFGSTGKN
jgi:hypothetical protein